MLSLPLSYKGLSLRLTAIVIVADAKLNSLVSRNANQKLAKFVKNKENLLLLWFQSIAFRFPDFSPFIKYPLHFWTQILFLRQHLFTFDDLFWQKFTFSLLSRYFWMSNKISTKAAEVQPYQCSFVFRGSIPEAKFYLLELFGKALQ